ncbi:MAG: glycosyltransferase family 4 protein, partial [Flavobacteriaceae bacterium]|nr:glycosyltransferase family 4 protein [Flavobacteriaceae bacterium]
NEINFIEKLPFNEVLESIQSADVLLLSSVEEGIANVVLESMALGTLVVSTDCGGMDEVLIDSENGFLIPPRDANAMASALVKTSKLSLKAYQKIIKNARDTVEKQHNYPKMIDEMHDLYSQILNRKL